MIIRDDYSPKSSMRIAIASVCVLIGFTVHGADDPSTDQHFDSVVQRIETIMSEEDVPGCAVALVVDRQVVLQRGFGMADLEAGRPVDVDTVWRIGSVSKMLVSMSVMALQERGVLSLEDKLSRVAPGIPYKNAWEDSSPIRLVHLLEQSTGFDDMHPNEALLGDPGVSLEDALMFNPRSRTSRWEPGTFATYSNVNAAVAAGVVEKVSGQRYEEFVSKTFFAPLEMTSASYFLDDQVKSNLAKGYRYVDDQLEPVEYWHIPFRPSGSVNASLKDMTTLLQFFLHRGEFQGVRLLQEESIERMERVTSTLAAKNGLKPGYGLNMMVRPMMGHTWFGHTGVMDGYQAALFYMPEYRAGVVTLMNENNPRVFGKITNQFLRFLTGGFPDSKQGNEGVSSTVDLERLTGTYRRASAKHRTQFAIRRLGLTTLTAKDGHLESESVFGSKSKFTPAAGKLFFVDKRKTPTVIHFDHNGQHYYQQEGFDTYVRVAAWRAWGELSLAIACLVLFVSTIVYAAGLAVGRMLGVMGKCKHWNTRLLPVYALLCLLFGQIVRVVIGQEDIMRSFTWGGLAEYLLTWCFLLVSVCGVVAAFLGWKRRIAVHPVIKMYVGCVSMANVAMMSYIFYWVTWLPGWLY